MAAETVSTYLTQIQMVPPLPNAKRGYGYNFDAREATKKVPARIAYGSGTNVWIRKIDEPYYGYMHRNHLGKVTSCRLSPNCEWLISTDNTGKYKVWAIRDDNEEPIFKTQGECGQSLNDCGWSFDGKRIIMGGEGKEEKGKCTPWDSTNQNGIFVNPTGPILSLDFRQKRPFRVIVASEDFGVYFYKGPPFKLMVKNQEHHKFVNCCRFSPNCEMYATTSSDKKVNLYHGKTGEFIRPLVESGTCHGGSIYSLAWSADSTRLVTCAADKKVKVWDVETGDCLNEFVIGRAEVRDMQVGVTWPRDDLIISLSVDGDMTYIHPEEGPQQTITGHKTSIQDMAVDRENGFVYTCGGDGKLVCTSRDGTVRSFRGETHGRFRSIKQLVVSSDGAFLYSAGLNDIIAMTDTAGEEMGEGTNIGGAVRFLAAHPSDPNVCVGGNNQGSLVVLMGGAIGSRCEQGGNFRCGTFNMAGDKLFVGTEGGTILSFTFDGSTLTFESENSFRGNTIQIRKVAMSPDDVNIIAVLDNQQQRIVNTETWDLSMARSLKYHTGQVNDVAWDPTSDNLVTVSLDQSIVVVDDPRVGPTRHTHLRAHEGGVNAVDYLADGTIVTCGADGSIKFWNKS